MTAMLAFIQCSKTHRESSSLRRRHFLGSGSILPFRVAAPGEIPESSAEKLRNFYEKS
jgi:hypothetical protein